MAEWSKALVLGTSLKGRGFESHHCQGVLKKILGPFKSKRPWRHRGLNPGPLTCEASALPLSYIPNNERKCSSFYKYEKDSRILISEWYSVRQVAG